MNALVQIKAVDFIQKPNNKASVSTIVDELVTKIQRASHARVTLLASTKGAERKNKNRIKKMIRGLLVMGFKFRVTDECEEKDDITNTSC